MAILLATAILTAGMLAPRPSSAEYPAPFKIAIITVSGSTNLHFRVGYSGTTPLCSNGPTAGNPWAYLNETDSGAKGKIATLLMAYALRKTVTIETQSVLFGTSTYCHILDVNVSD